MPAGLCERPSLTSDWRVRCASKGLAESEELQMSDFGLASELFETVECGLVVQDGVQTAISAKQTLFWDA